METVNATMIRPRGGTSAASALALLGIVLVAAWLRFEGLTARELWFDESCTFYAAHHFLDWPADGPDPRRELAHRPYYLLLHGWMRLVGDTDWGLRSFSALMGCLAVLAVGGVGRQVGGRAVGLMAACLAAAHPLHNHYSQEARVYTLWTLEVAICLFLLLRAGGSAKVRWWIAYAVGAWLAVLTHYYTLLWLPATWTVVFVAKNRRRVFRQWLITNAFLAAALAPVVAYLILPISQAGPKPWLRKIWLEYPPLMAVPRSIWALLASGDYPDYLGALAASADSTSAMLGAPAGHMITWGPAALAIAMCVIVALRKIRVEGPTARPRANLLFVFRFLRNGNRKYSAKSARGKARASEHENGKRSHEDAAVSIGERHQGPAAAFLLLLTLVFLMTAWTHSWLIGPTYVVGRYDLAAWPSLTVGTALLIDIIARRPRAGRVQRTVVRIALTTCLLVCSLTTVMGARRVPVENDLTLRARRVASVVGPRDLVVSLNMYRWFMTYEWHRLGMTTRVISFPPAHDRQLCWYDAEAELTDRAKMAADAKRVVGEVARTLATEARAWVLAFGEPTGPRWEVDRHFFAELAKQGFSVQLRDEWVGLAEVTASSRLDTPLNREEE